ncbi:MAG: hypothetical protein IPK07_26620 [Deltaproteobacteria bacterium]|nr:hypothetical protein [Deltaproteobacteria bacterium]
MNLSAARARLVEAELAVAHFNALRTCAAGAEGAIRRDAVAGFEVLLDPSRPSNPYYNRSVPAHPAALAEEGLAALPAGVVAVETAPGELDPGCADRLLARGFGPAWQLCYLAADPRGHTGAGLAGPAVVRLGASDRGRFFDLLELEGVPFPSERRAAKAAYYCTDTFRSYLALAEHGEPMAWTTMYVGDGFAFLGNSFTLPEHRRKGAHAALLAARLADAAVLGLALAFTDVEHGSQSHANCERAGFRTLTIRIIWSKRA